MAGAVLTLHAVEEFDEVDDLETEIEAMERARPGTRRRIEELGEVFRVTTTLWQRREQLGLSVEEIAERSGLPLDDVERVEDNDVHCPHDILSRYGKAVGLQFGLRPVSVA